MSELMLLIFGAVLVLGIFGEYKTLPRRLLLWPASVFEVLVMIGVAGELLGDGGVFVFSGHLQAIEDRGLSTFGSNAGQLEARLKTVGDKVSQVESTAGAALTKSAGAVIASKNSLALARGARSEADSFEKDINSAKIQSGEAKAFANEAKTLLADAHSLAAEARQQASEAAAGVIRINTPRSLTNVSELVSALKPFKDTEYSFSSVFQDSESIDLLKAIEGLLQQAGWKKVKSPHGFPALNVYGKEDGFAVPIGFGVGVQAFVDSSESIAFLQSLSVDKLPPLERAAAVLTAILRSHISPESPDNVKAAEVSLGTAKTVRIAVGKKPP